MNTAVSSVVPQPTRFLEHSFFDICLVIFSLAFLDLLQGLQNIFINFLQRTCSEELMLQGQDGQGDW